ncbi:DUF6758 family protein [Halostreptopolyspora alba]|uniref:Phosphotransacetylase n=1 Tax=Halostreptopolyspora alba TaxID=2487137 RepID=A0A3N0EC70_9ACTN|nr:hypothetical protein EFW17_07975 [Nocardiopsaceae bacterium YIM 96095]
MKPDPTCPRCGRAVHAPNLWSSAWQCDAHGQVPPLNAVRGPNLTSLELVIGRANVPVWVPWPLPAGWVVTGFADAGDERSGAVAVAVALSGPAPLGGVGEMVTIAEEPGVGLGARVAAIEGPDPGTGFDTGAVHSKIRHDGHDIAMWSIQGGEDRAVYVGEALADWMWFVLSPADTGVLMAELNGMRDLRDRHDGGATLDPPFGALSPFLSTVLRPLRD